MGEGSDLAGLGASGPRSASRSVKRQVGQGSSVLPFNLHGSSHIRFALHGLRVVFMPGFGALVVHNVLDLDGVDGRIVDKLGNDILADHDVVHLLLPLLDASKFGKGLNRATNIDLAHALLVVELPIHLSRSCSVLELALLLAQLLHEHKLGARDNLRLEKMQHVTRAGGITHVDWVVRSMRITLGIDVLETESIRFGEESFTNLDLLLSGKGMTGFEEAIPHHLPF